MVRKSYAAFAVLALATMSIIGCGKEDVTDLTNSWTKAENDLNSKLTEVKAAHTDLMQKCQMMPMANTTDTAKMADEQAMMKTLAADEASLGEIDAKVAELKAKREDAEKSGKRADIEGAWNSAKSDYDALNAKLDGIKDDNSKYKSNPMSGDTATGAGTTMGTDTATIHGTKMEGGMVKEGTKMAAGSGSSAGGHEVGNGKAAQKDTKKTDKNDKPLIQLNKNP